MRLTEKTRLIGLSVSLGGVSSCIEHAQSMSHSMLGAMDSALLAASAISGPSAGLVRLAVGVEDAGELLRDLVASLESLS